MHNAAREMVFVAEQGVMADKNRLDPTWQEMLNHATCKVSPRQPGHLLPFSLPLSVCPQCSSVGNQFQALLAWPLGLWVSQSL